MIVNKPKVELRFKCSNLKNLDVLTKSDPQIFVTQNRGIGAGEFIGSTEKIKNDLNPIFKKTITLDYYFEQTQTLNFVVMDIDKEIKLFGDLDNNDKIGEFSTTLGNIISRPGKKLIGEIKHKGHTTGKIEITAEEIQETGHNVIFKIQGHKLDKKDLFSSDPYLKIYKTSTNGDNLLVYTSEVIDSNLNPIFEAFILKVEELNGGDMFRELLFEVWDYDKATAHDFIGSFRTTTDEILKSKLNGINLEFPLINSKKTGKSNYRNSGIISFLDARLVGKPTFIDYVSGGTELNLIVAIDCTLSNGEPNNESSLHYNNKAKGIYSEYAQSIMSVGSVLAPYDTDGKIPVLGFGGIRQGSSETSHCFEFGDKAEAKGVEGVLSMYSSNIQKIELSFPTNFKDIIHHASKQSLKNFDSKHLKYTILLILTDGDISDIKETKKEIIKASKESPLSIVIVGVGHLSFDSMNELDADIGPLSIDGITASRDIVQFVQFQNFVNNPTALASETLCEIPNQLLSFMDSHNYLPKIRY